MEQLNFPSRIEFHSLSSSLIPRLNAKLECFIPSLLKRRKYLREWSLQVSLSVERSVFTSRLFIFAGTRSRVKINEGKGILLSKPKFKATPITRIINSAWENRQTTNYYPTHRERISLPVENYSHNNNLIAILDVQFLIRR